eukprot:scaffold86218_cov66-Phaeocystis_antarctica.AAC.2
MHRPLVRRRCALQGRTSRSAAFPRQPRASGWRRARDKNSEGGDYRPEPRDAHACMHMQAPAC